VAAVAPLPHDRARAPAHRLRLAPPPRPTSAPTFGDAVYAATLAVLLACGIVGVLLLNTATQTQADRIAAQKQRLAGLALQIQSAQVALDRDAAPAVVAARARALAMRPAAKLAVLHAPRTPTFAPPRAATGRAPAARRAHAG
jgi:hypothetical protein